MSREHQYTATTTWTAADGKGTKDYKSYSRTHTISVDGKVDITASSDPAFRGDSSLHNPEDMLVAATSSCHMLWYLHFCAVNNIEVLSYEDTAVGIMSEGDGSGGHFTQITLNPRIEISADSDPALAEQLHRKASKECFIANTLKCPVEHKATIVTKS